MLSTPIFTRSLSTYEYGVYSTYSSWEMLLSMIVTLCLYKAMMNLYIRHEDRGHVLSSICALELILSGTWAVVAVIFRRQISSILRLSPTLVCCMFIYFVFSAPVQCWSLHERYEYDYKPLVAVTLALAIGSVLFGLLAVLLIKPTAEMRAIPAVAVSVLIGAFLYCFIFTRNKAVYDKNIWRFALGFCIPLMPHYLSEFVLQSSDKIMINYFCGASDVALYSVAYSAGSLITLITSAINSSFAPYQYQKLKSGEYELLSKRVWDVLLLVGVMLSIIMIFSKEIVMILGGAKYEDSVEVIIPICIGVYFNYVFQLFARVQEYYEQKLKVVIPSVFCAVLNLVLNYIFIKKYGYQAAAYTTLVCYGVFCIVHYIFYRSVCNSFLSGRKIYDAKSIAMCSLFVILCGAITMLLNNVLWIKYLIILVILIVFVWNRRIFIQKIRNVMKKD